MKKIAITALTIAAMGTGAYAAGSALSLTKVKVQEVYATFGGTLYVATSGTEGNLNCTSPGNKYVSVGANDPGKNAIYSMMLTAETTGTPVTIRIQQGTDGCRILYAHMNK